jgi:hypothetical protein
VGIVRLVQTATVLRGNDAALDAVFIPWEETAIYRPALYGLIVPLRRTRNSLVL